MATRTSVDVAAIRERHAHHFGRPGRDRQVLMALGVAAVLLLLFGMAQFGFFDGTFLSGVLKLGEIAGLMMPPNPGDWAHVRLYLMALIETIAISLLGTLCASIIALPVAMLAARNVTAARVLRFFTRRSLDAIRSVDTLIWALIWINVVGLGPFAGVLAIMTSDIGNFGKLFSEAIEAADNKPREGIVASGGGAILGIRFGILPEIFPVLASQVLYFFESNTRSATIIGIVGAGGIGLHLAEAIRTLELQQASFIILLILVTVAAIDIVSNQLRFALIGRRGQLA
jgi:phosphonate transport system permease protein